MAIVDREGDLITGEALRAGLPQLLLRGRLSLQHGDILVGEILKGWGPYVTDVRPVSEADMVEYPHLLKGGVKPGDEMLFVVGKIYDDTDFSLKVRSEIEKGELNSFSISGQSRVEGKKNVCDSFTCKLVNQIDAVDLSAVTVCKTGMNQGAAFKVVAKSADERLHALEKEIRFPGDIRMPVLRHATEYGQGGHLNAFEPEQDDYRGPSMEDESQGATDYWRARKRGASRDEAESVSDWAFSEDPEMIGSAPIGVASDVVGFRRRHVTRSADERLEALEKGWHPQMGPPKKQPYGNYWGADDIGPKPGDEHEYHSQRMEDHPDPRERKASRQFVAELEREMQREYEREFGKAPEKAPKRRGKDYGPMVDEADELERQARAYGDQSWQEPKRLKRRAQRIHDRIGAGGKVKSPEARLAALAKDERGWVAGRNVAPPTPRGMLDNNQLTDLGRQTSNNSFDEAKRVNQMRVNVTKPTVPGPGQMNGGAKAPSVPKPGKDSTFDASGNDEMKEPRSPDEIELAMRGVNTAWGADGVKNSTRYDKPGIKHPFKHASFDERLEALQKRGPSFVDETMPQEFGKRPYNPYEQQQRRMGAQEGQAYPVMGQGRDKKGRPVGQPTQVGQHTPIPYRTSARERAGMRAQDKTGQMPRHPESQMGSMGELPSTPLEQGRMGGRGGGMKIENWQKKNPMTGKSAEARLAALEKKRDPGYPVPITKPSWLKPGEKRNVETGVAESTGPQGMGYSDWPTAMGFDFRPMGGNKVKGPSRGKKQRVWMSSRYGSRNAETGEERLGVDPDEMEAVERRGHVYSGWPRKGPKRLSPAQSQLAQAFAETEADKNQAVVDTIAALPHIKRMPWEREEPIIPQLEADRYRARARDLQFERGAMKSHDCGCGHGAKCCKAKREAWEGRLAVLEKGDPYYPWRRGKTNPSFETPEPDKSLPEAYGFATGDMNGLKRVAEVMSGESFGYPNEPVNAMLISGDKPNESRMVDTTVDEQGFLHPNYPRNHRGGYYQHQLGSASSPEVRRGTEEFNRRYLTRSLDLYDIDAGAAEEIKSAVLNTSWARSNPNLAQFVVGEVMDLTASAEEEEQAQQEMMQAQQEMLQAQQQMNGANLGMAGSEMTQDIESPEEMDAAFGKYPEDDEDFQELKGPKRPTGSDYLDEEKWRALAEASRQGKITTRDLGIDPNAPPYPAHEFEFGPESRFAYQHQRNILTEPRRGPFNDTDTIPVERAHTYFSPGMKWDMEDERSTGNFRDRFLTRSGEEEPPIPRPKNPKHYIHPAQGVNPDDPLEMAAMQGDLAETEKDYLLNPRNLPMHALRGQPNAMGIYNDNQEDSIIARTPGRDFVVGGAHAELAPELVDYWDRYVQRSADERIEALEKIRSQRWDNTDEEALGIGPDDTPEDLEEREAMAGLRGMFGGEDPEAGFIQPNRQYAPARETIGVSSPTNITQDQWNVPEVFRQRYLTRSAEPDPPAYIQTQRAPTFEARLEALE